MGKNPRAKAFEKEALRSILTYGYGFRIPDVALGFGQRVVGQRTPADLSWYCEQFAALIECKSVSGTRFPFSNVEDHQQAALEAVAKYPHSRGYVFINFYQKDKTRYSVNRAFLIDINTFVILKHITGFKSLTVEEAGWFGIECDRIKRKVGDKSEVIWCLEGVLNTSRNHHVTAGSLSVTKQNTTQSYKSTPTNKPNNSRTKTTSRRATSRRTT